MRASPSCLAAVLFLALGSPAAGAPIEGFATLWVGVHRDAGGAADVVAEGAAGPCLTSAVRLLCPAVGPVVFRWAGAPGWELVGEATVGAGQEGTAWVLANELTRAPQRAALASPSLTAEQVLALYTRTGATLPPPASAGMLEDLVRLARHDDPTVRRAVVDALFPWVTGAAWGVLPPEAPLPIPDGLLGALANDADPRVRRRVAALAKDVRPSELSAEAEAVAAALAHDSRRSVRRAALASSTTLAIEDPEAATDAWVAALAIVPEPGPVGRGAVGALARLRGDAPASDPVDPSAALDLVLEHHTERAWRYWTAWRREIPFDPERAERLLRGTVGVDPTLMRHWSTADPDGLTDVLARWEPGPEHSERHAIIAAVLAQTPHAALREVLLLPPEHATEP